MPFKLTSVNGVNLLNLNFFDTKNVGKLYVMLTE